MGIRDPFDNVISRFRYSHTVHKRRKEEFPYSMTATGFGDYCRELDATFLEDVRTFLSADAFEKAQKVPCYSIFHQYTLWHNNAFSVSRTYHLPTMIIYYEDYDKRLGKIANELLDFLDQERVGENRKFE